MSRGYLSRRAARGLAAVSAALLVGSTLLVGGTAAADVNAAAPTSRAAADDAADRHPHGAKPTVVLVHGAFADASGWSAEISYLQRHGYPALAPANPLRGLTSDGAYIRSVLDTIPGPVVLVGHSYGGAVITNAAAGASNVKALVFVSAFAPAPGESVAKFTDPANYPGSLLVQHLLIRPVANPVAPAAADGNPLNDADAYIDPASFRQVFAGDLDPRKAAVLGASQRPLSYFADTEASGPAAWTTTPCWALVGLEDKAIPPAAQKFMAHRACDHVKVIHSAHDSLITHAGQVDELIEQAAASIR
jgi:pimeloyl-ACP methyl ester carboxylesterase